MVAIAMSCDSTNLVHNKQRPTSSENSCIYPLQKIEVKKVKKIFSSRGKMFSEKNLKFWEILVKTIVGDANLNRSYGCAEILR